VYSLLGHVHIGLPTEIYVYPELEALEEAVYKGFSSQKEDKYLLFLFEKGEIPYLPDRYETIQKIMSAVSLPACNCCCNAHSCGLKRSCCASIIRPLTIPPSDDIVINVTLT
jgi:hypothetical protein